MARKPITKPQDKDTTGEANSPVPDADRSETAAQNSAAPETSPAPDDGDAAALSEAVAAIEGPGPILPAAMDIIINLPDPAFVVTCYRKDGRRRAGRRWGYGKTEITADELSAFQLAQLNADPAFSVIAVDAD